MIYISGLSKKLVGVYMIMLLISAYDSSRASPMEENSPPSSLTQGAYTLGLTFGYTPSGDEGQLVGKDGIVYRWVQVDRKSQITIDASYRFSEQLSAQLEAQAFRSSLQYAINDGQTRNVESLVNMTWGTKGEIRYRLNLRRFDPEVYINVSYPWSAGAGASSSIVSDPVIIQGALEYGAGLVSPDSHIAASGKIGFVVNESVSLVCAVRHTLAFGKLKIPETTISFGASYMVGSEAQTKVSMLAVNNTIGNHSKVGFLINLHSEGGSS